MLVDSIIISKADSERERERKTKDIALEKVPILRKTIKNKK